MHSNCLISVIMPVYNSEKFLADAIDSVFNQTYSNIELILIDDGSTDNSVMIIEEYLSKFPSQIHFYTQKNQGASAARNNALKYVSGDYIAYVDSDDILASDYFERFLSVALESNVDIVVGGYEKFDNDTGEVFYTHNSMNWVVEFVSDKKYVFQYSPCAKIFRTSFLLENEILFGCGEILEDGPYNIMCNILANNIEVIDYIGYRYRATRNSVQGNLYKKNSSPKLPYNAIKAAIATVRKHSKNDFDEQILEYCIVKALAGYATNMGRNMNNETRKALCAYCYATIKENFPDVSKNPYIKLGKLKTTPISHRVAVRMFICAYRVEIL